jgi:hypothetical protein
MTTQKLTALAATTAIALAGIAPATGAAKATTTGKHTVNVESAYVYEKAGGVRFAGTMYDGNTFKVKRISPTGKWAYGMAYGHVDRHVWITTSALERKR